MDGVTHVRVEDDAEILNENTNNADDNGGLGGDNPSGGSKPATTTTGTEAPKESGGKEDTKVPNTSSGDGGGNIGGSGDDSEGDSTDESTTYVQFPDTYVPVYYVKDNAGTIEYKTAKDIVVKNIFWQTSDDVNLGNATSTKSDAFSRAGAFREVSASHVVLSLEDELLSKYYGKTMEILFDWESDDDKFTGKTRSLLFSVSNAGSPNATLENEISSLASKETSLEETTAATSTSSATASSSADSSGGGKGGLSTGATAGIAVGAVIGGLLIIGALAFFLLRRRRRSKQLGEDYNSQQAYTVDKETHGRATDSPNSPYSDENQVQPVALQNISHDHDEQTARGTPTPSAVPRASTGSRGAPTPQGMSSNVAHLVEDGMTADEIRRLEQEERELDDEIERAARR